MTLKREIAKAYKATNVYQIDRLLALERQWKRRATIAQNKLAHTRQQINKFAEQLAHESIGERTQ